MHAVKIGRYLLAFVIIMTGAIIYSEGGYVDYRHLKDTLASLQEENSHIAQENDALKEEILLLGNDLMYIERIARQELGLVRTDETVYRFIEEHPLKGVNKTRVDDTQPTQP